MTSVKINFISGVIAFLILMVSTVILTVTTRSIVLPIDPVLFSWAIIVLVFCRVVFKSWLLVIALSAPLLILSLLPAIGYPEFQNNPHNPNLLSMHFYYTTAVYLVVVLGASSKHGKVDA